MTPKRHSFVPAKRIQRPLAQGSFDVAGIPIGYELKADAYLDAGLGFWSAPAMLTDIELLAQGEEAERLRGHRRQPIPGLPLEAPQLERPRPRGTLEGSARLRFDAGANLDASAGAKVSGGATLADAVSAGGYGKLGGSARAAAQLHVDNMVFLTWKDGEISLRSDTIPGFWLGFDLEFVIAAEAGVYVELRVPEIPVVTSLYNELNSWPGLGWILPDLDSLRWRGEYGKSWQLAARRYHHNVPLDLAIGASGIEPVVKPDAGPQPDEMLNDAGKKQREELKDDPVGPGEKKLKGDAGAMAAARAAAKAQLASTREIIDREKSVTAKLLAQARRTAAAKPTSAAAGGVQMAAVDPPGGGKADDTPVEQLERRQDALADADSKRQTLETASKDLLAPAAAPDGPTRNKARVALDAVAQNADTLGDKVNSGDGDLARPTDTGNAADAPAMKELGDLEPATLALADEARDAIGTEKELLGRSRRRRSAPAGRAYKDAHDAYRKAVKKAGDQWTPLERDVKAAQSLRLSDPAGAAAKFEALGERARKLRDDAKGLAALRPQEPPPAETLPDCCPQNFGPVEVRIDKGHPHYGAKIITVHDGRAKHWRNVRSNGQSASCDVDYLASATDPDNFGPCLKSWIAAVKAKDANYGGQMGSDSVKNRAKIVKDVVENGQEINASRYWGDAGLPVGVDIATGNATTKARVDGLPNEAHVIPQESKPT